jgi:hypothetical protein
MTVGDFTTALQYLRANDSITVTIEVAAFERAMEMATGGPEVMSTAQAAAVFGFSAKRWRRWAEADRIDGAWLDHEKGKKRGVWRLPREGCRRVIEEEQRKGRTRAKGNQERVATRNVNAGKKTGTSRERRVVSHQAASSTTGRRVLRGPRKA